jgi:hypothetical protein
MTTPTTSRSNSRRNLWLGLGGCALLALCLCLIAGGVGGYLYFQQGTPPVASAAGPSVEYVLDASPRMTLPSQNGTRLTVARGVLAEIIRPADPSVMAGLRVFGTGAVAKSCQDTDLLVPLALSNQKMISDKAFRLEAGQSTDAALAQAIVTAIRDLATKKGSHSLVVVTGGADSCNPEASQVVAQEAKHSGIDLETYVIGFDVSDADAQAIKVITDETPKGRYLHASTEGELRTTLRGVQDRIDHPATQYLKQSACDYPYFPMRKGASWEYTVGGKSMKETITDITGDLNNSTATLQVDMDGVSMTSQWTCTPEGVISYDLTDFQLPQGAGTNAQFKMSGQSGTSLLPPDKLAPGATWDNKYTMSMSMDMGTGQAFNITYDISQQYTATGVETVIVGADTYEAIRVDATGQIKITGLPADIPAGLFPTEIPMAYTEWFARGVGLVRSTSTTGKGDDKLLVKYTMP